MNDLIVVLALLVPVAIVIAILSNQHKKQQKQKQQKHQAFLNKILEQNDITVSYRKDLATQILVIDVASMKILVANHKDDQYDFDLYKADEIKSVRLYKFTNSIAGAENNRKAESFVTQIGLELVSAKPAIADKQIVFYDHLHHNIFMMAELEREALRVQERIRQLVTNKMVAL